MRTISLTVNDEAVTAIVEPRTSLADFLRDNLHLKGTHLGCEQGACGACTVHLNGRPVRSCITFAVSCDGADIRSVEGLDDPVSTSLRQAFSQEHALQCGYCTPGMLMTARDIVERLHTPDTDEIRRELAGCICRCTGYRGIVRAIARVISEKSGKPA
ncbi:(2Fe-2S)-binding protein [Amorphus sp. MBR-141]